MKRIVTILIALCLGALSLSAQMSDAQVISYVKKGIEAGKSKDEIGRELVAKGVSPEQLSKLMKAYQESSSDDTAFSASSDAAYRTSSLDPHKSLNRQRSAFVEENQAPASKEVGIPAIPVFGHDIFTLKELSFEPNENAATPSDYVLGPGDVVVIDVWGVNEAAIEAKISPDGKISLEQIGPVTLSGLTIRQAEAKLKKTLSQKYSLSGLDAESQLSVTLGNIRTVKINVIGEVIVPGTYRLSSMSTVFTALYRAGGVTDLGSLRNIQISRGGKMVGTVDLYKFIFDGQKAGNISLEDDDVIIVPPYRSLVTVLGGVKRPMIYEAADGESVGTMIRYAGGFSSRAYTSDVTVERIDGEKGKVINVLENEYPSYLVNDGDVLTVKENIREDLFQNRVEVRGSVMRPGIYAIGGDIATVKQLVNSCGGLLEDAFLQRAQLVREKEDRSLEILSIAIGAIMSSSVEDVMLRKNDVLIVSDANAIFPKGEVTIDGYVNNPGTFPFKDNMSVEDLIIIAGGLKPGVSLLNVEVSRRIYDPYGTQAPDSLAQVFSYSLKDGLPLDGKPRLTLQPYDIVSIRKSPTYNEQMTVSVSGEVLFPGQYTLVSNNERLSDVFRRAGAATPNAYVSGAVLKRRFTDAELQSRKKLEFLAETAADSVNISKMVMDRFYTVGIQLDKALANPGSDSDIVLRDGDELLVPPMINTVRIQGEVYYPNVVNFVEGKTVSYYIKQAGGFSKEALRGEVFIVYLNGQVDRGSNAVVLPGCEIVVPTRPQRKKMTVGEWIGIGTASASLATMIVTLVNLFK